MSGNTVKISEYTASLFNIQRKALSESYKIMMKL